MRFFLQEEVHDLADENDDHADGGDPLEAEVEEPAAPSTEKVAVDEPSAQEVGAQEQGQVQVQESTNVEESAEASTTEPVPAVRKPLFGKSLATLNA